jgi:site-specific DNA-methyltransferase (adenine-specific)/modification methylase
MARIPDDFFHIVITSPPYNMNLRLTNGKYRSRQIVKEFSTKYAGFDDNLPIEEYNRFHSEVLSELLRISSLVFYNIQIVTGSKRSVFRMIGDFADNLKEIIVWDKGHGQPAAQEQVLNKRTELILVFEKDTPTGAVSRRFQGGQFKRGTIEDLWEIPRGKSPSQTHGAVFPERLVETILKNFTQEKNKVFDPFMGTGTTGVVAEKLGRHFWGCEVIEDYFAIAQQRISNEINSRRWLSGRWDWSGSSKKGGDRRHPVK